MLKIWGRPESINTQKILWSCEELGLPFRRFDPDRPNGNRIRGPLADEPIPVVDSRGLVLWESNALMRYLFAQSSAPTTPAERESSDAWVDWSTSVFLPVLRILSQNVSRQRHGAFDEPSRRRAEEIAELATSLERTLESSDFLCGDELAMADVAVGAAVWHWLILPLPRADLPAVTRWIERLRERPGFAAHLSPQQAGSGVDSGAATSARRTAQAAG